MIRIIFILCLLLLDSSGHQVRLVTYQATIYNSISFKSGQRFYLYIIKISKENVSKILLENVLEDLQVLNQFLKLIRVFNKTNLQVTI